MEPNDPNMTHITRSIQLLANANLISSRTRRSLTVPAVKSDIRPYLFSLPVKHTHLFGDEFDIIAEGALKKQASSNKVLFTPRRQEKVVPQTTASHNQPGHSTQSSNNKNSTPTRGTFRGSSRGRGSRGKSGGGPRSQ